ncbi:MAG TPA: hypothetical protein VI818_04265, partial [Candidatus Thermoplasmatota archaeon]|nr:hypothetical protein [Candidatus Thermoplasmatota archaeon]
MPTVLGLVSMVIVFGACADAKQDSAGPGDEGGGHGRGQNAEAHGQAPAHDERPSPPAGAQARHEPQTPTESHGMQARPDRAQDEPQGLGQEASAQDAAAHDSDPPRSASAPKAPPGLAGAHGHHGDDGTKSAAEAASMMPDGTPAASPAADSAAPPREVSRAPRPTAFQESWTHIDPQALVFARPELPVSGNDVARLHAPLAYPLGKSFRADAVGDEVDGRRDARVEDGSNGLGLPLFIGFMLSGLQVVMVRRNGTHGDAPNETSATRAAPVTVAAT